MKRQTRIQGDAAVCGHLLVAAPAASTGAIATPFRIFDMYTDFSAVASGGLRRGENLIVSGDERCVRWMTRGGARRRNSNLRVVPGWPDRGGALLALRSRSQSNQSVSFRSGPGA